MKSSMIFKSILLLSLFSVSVNAEILNFSKAYELALENSHDIKASVYLYESDEEKINLEESRLYPQINMSAYYKKSEYVSNPGDEKSKQGLLNYALSVGQSIYDPEIYSRIDIQESRSKYSQINVELEKERLAQLLFDTYLDVLKSKNRIELLKSYKEYYTNKLQELTKKYEMQLSNKMDLLEIKVDFNSAQIDLNKEIKLFDVYNLKLKKLIGNIEYKLPKIDADNSISDMIELMKERVYSDKESLKIKQAKVAVQISKNEIDNAEDGHYPKLNLSANYAQYDTDDPNIEAPYDNTQSIMLTLKIPIYSGGYVSSKVASAKLKAKANMEDLMSIRKDVKIEYSEYMAFFEASAESVSMYKEALVSAELYVEAITQGYDSGLKSVTDLNDAKNKFYEVKYKYIDNIYGLVNAYIGLLIVTNSVDDMTMLDKLVE